MRVWNSTLDVRTPLKSNGVIKRRRPLKKRSKKFADVLDRTSRLTAAVIDKYGDTCIMSSQSNGCYGPIVADHIYKKNSHPEYRFVVENCRPLCMTCNQRREHDWDFESKYRAKIGYDNIIEFLKSGHGTIIN